MSVLKKKIYARKIAGRSVAQCQCSTSDLGYAIGPASVLFPAMAKFAQDIKEKHLLELQVHKTEAFSWTGILPPEAPAL